MTIRIEAIVPRKAVPLDAKAVEVGVHRFLRDFATAVQREMSDYPPALPWKRPPRAGLRRGGRRTGAYGRGWTTPVARYTGNSVTVVNPVPYGVFVGGPKQGTRGRRQARAMAARGWPSISDVAPGLAKRLRPLLVRRIVGG